jgi:hypothetical protein
MALVYLVNKPQVLRHIIRWLLLFLEYEFTVIYIPSCIHVVTNSLFKLLDTIELTGVLNQTTNATLFMFQLVWLEEVKNYL